MITVAFITALDETNKYLENIGGVPLIIRACLNISKALPKEQIIILSKNMDLLNLVKSYGFNYSLVADNCDSYDSIRNCIKNRIDSSEIGSYLVYKPEMLLNLEDTVNMVLELSEKVKNNNLINMVLKCKLVICDVDGVLTDGKMVYTEKGDEIRNFNVKDGIAANLLKEKGIKLVMLSSGTNLKTVTKRGNKLNFDIISIEEGDKLTRFNQIIEKLGVERDRVLYIGDDINDLQVLKQVGVSVCPSDANKMVLNQVDWILESKGGDGCLREVADYILEWGGYYENKK